MITSPGRADKQSGTGPRLTLAGDPGELTLFGAGRQRAARVEISGDAALADQLRAAKLGIRISAEMSLSREIRGTKNHGSPKAKDRIAPEPRDRDSNELLTMCLESEPTSHQLGFNSSRIRSGSSEATSLLAPNRSRWRERGSVELPTLPRVSAQNYYRARTFCASGPFRPFATSNSTCCPSSRERYPPPLMLEKWTKTSFSPSDGLMKPNPFSLLKNFTVPVAISVSLLSFPCFVR